MKVISPHQCKRDIEEHCEILRRKTFKFLLPLQKIFSLENITQILKFEITHMVTWWPSTPSPPKALWQAVQLPLQQKNHQANLHTVAASLRIVVHPPVAFQATYFHLSGQSTVSLDSLCSGSVQILTVQIQNPHNQKKETLISLFNQMSMDEPHTIKGSTL